MEMNDMQSCIESLRSFVCMKSWDYCVVWKVNDDQRFIEEKGCWCIGSEKILSSEGEEEDLFHCRDVSFQHPRTKTCEILAGLPSSMPLDCGIHSKALLSRTPIWIKLSSVLDSNDFDETLGTRVLIPVPGGVVELFAAKHVPEDQHLKSLIAAHWNSTSNKESTHKIVKENTVGHQLEPFSTVDHSKIIALQQSLEPPSPTWHPLLVESSASKQPLDGKDLMKNEVGQLGRDRSSSLPPWKIASKRRTMHNDRLFVLRSLVPKINKSDTSSTIMGAVDYIRELQKQAKDLRDQLVEMDDGDGYNDYNGVRSQAPDHNLVGQDESSYDLWTRDCPGSERIDGNARQMKAQVEVTQVDHKMFFLKVIDGQKPSGFTRLLEALSMVGLEVISVNITTFKGMVMNIFIVERTNEAIQVDEVRNWLLKLMSNSSEG